MAIKIKYVQDDSAEGVEVIVRAKEHDEEVSRVMDLLGGETRDVLLCRTLSAETEVDVHDVVIISKNGRLLSVKTLDGEYVLSDPLYKIEETLDPRWFVKISQSEIVNLRYVERWALEGGGIISIEMKGGIKSYTSRRYATKIRATLAKGGKR